MKMNLFLIGIPILIAIRALLETNISLSPPSSSSSIVLRNMRGGGENVTMTQTFHPDDPDYTNNPASSMRDFGISVSVIPNGIGVTAIIPFHDKCDFFEETYISIKRSTYPVRIMVFDDASKPESRPCIRKICSECILFESNESVGMCNARNILLEHVETEYILSIDPDDLIEPTYVEKAVWIMETNRNIHVVKGDSVGFGEYEYVWTRGFSTPRFFPKENVNTQAAVHRTSYFRELGGHDDTFRKGMEDYEYWIRMADRGDWGYQIPGEIMDWYRRNPVTFWNSPDNLSELYRKIVDMYPKVMLNSQLPKIPTIPVDTYRPVDVFEFSRIRGKYSRTGRGNMMMIVPWFAVGGADMVNYNVAIHMKYVEDYNLTIVGTIQGHMEWMTKFKDITEDVVYLPTIVPKYAYIHYVMYLIDSRDIQVIYISNSEAGFYMLPLIKHYKPHVRIIALDHMEELGWRHGGHALHSKSMSDYIDSRILISQHLNKWMDDETKSHVCYNGVRPGLLNTDKDRVRHDIGQEYGIPANHKVVVFSSRMELQKRPHLIGDIIDRINHINLDVTFLIVGDGSLLPDLRERVSGKKNVHVLGTLSNEATLRITASGDFLVQPSMFEGMSIALIEAMALGTVPIATDVGGHREIIIHGVNGYIFSPFPEIKLVDDIVKVLSENYELTKNMSSRAKDTIAGKFTVDTFGACVANVIMKTESKSKLNTIGVAKEIYRLGSTLM